MTVCMVTRETNLIRICVRSKGPYYAMPIYPGDIGTNGGLLTNDKAQVIKKMASRLKACMPLGTMRHLQWERAIQAQGDIGPALTFGYIAARHMSGAND